MKQGNGLIRSVVGAFLLLSFSFCLKAGEKEDIIKMNSTLKNLNTLNMEVKISMYSSNSASPRVFKGNFIRNASNFYSSIMGKTTLVNKQHSLLIDEKQKVILFNAVNAVNRKEEEEKYSNELLKLDSSLTKEAKLKYLIVNDKIKRIEIVNDKKTIYEKVEIEIDAKTNLLKQVVYFFKTPEDKTDQPLPEKMVIDYMNLPFSEQAFATKWTEQKYIRMKGDEVLPSEVYKTYTVIDQRKNIIPFSK